MIFFIFIIIYFVAYSIRFSASPFCGCFFSMTANAPPAAAVRVLLVVSFLSFIVYRFGECQLPETARIARLTVRWQQIYYNLSVNSFIICSFNFFFISGASCCKNSRPKNKLPCFRFCLGSILSINIASKMSPRF